MKIYASEPIYELDQFIGQDVWVKVQQHMNSDTEFAWTTTPAYVRILDKYLDPVNHVYCYEFNSVHSRFISEPEFNTFVGEYLERFNRSYYGRCSRFFICEPLTILSTEDILELLGVQ